MDLVCMSHYLQSLHNKHVVTLVYWFRQSEICSIEIQLISKADKYFPQLLCWFFFSYSQNWQMESWNTWDLQFFLWILHGWVISRLLLGWILSYTISKTLKRLPSLRKIQVVLLILQGRVFPSLLSLFSIPALSQEELDKHWNLHSCWMFLLM